MGRFYNIVVSGAKGASAGFTGWSSQVGGRDDPGALDIEFDITEAAFNSPTSMPFLRVWGIDLKTISQASDFNGAKITVYAGMSAGLPLATPSQQGIIADGLIFQAFGNWIGTDMTLDLQISADGSTTLKDQPPDLNLVVNWAKGTTLQAALTTALKTAHPGYEVTGTLSPDLVAINPITHIAESVGRLSFWASDQSQSLVKKPNYPGVQISLHNKTYRLSDGTSSPTPKLLDFNAFIGQPTWIAPSQIQFNTVLRGDLGVDDIVTFPNQQQTTTEAEQAVQAKDKSSFSGKFRISGDGVRHVGNFRSPAAQNWISTFTAVADVV